MPPKGRSQSTGAGGTTAGRKQPRSTSTQPTASAVSTGTSTTAVNNTTAAAAKKTKRRRVVNTAPSTVAAAPGTITSSTPALIADDSTTKDRSHVLQALSSEHFNVHADDDGSLYFSGVDWRVDNDGTVMVVNPQRQVVLKPGGTRGSTWGQGEGSAQAGTTTVQSTPTAAGTGNTTILAQPQPIARRMDGGNAYGQPPRHLPHFGDDDNLDHFLSTFEDAAVYYGWTEDQRFFFLKTLLQGAPSQLVWAQRPADYNSLVDLLWVGRGNRKIQGRATNPPPPERTELANSLC